MSHARSGFTPVAAGDSKKWEGQEESHPTAPRDLTLVGYLFVLFDENLRSQTMADKISSFVFFNRCSFNFMTIFQTVCVAVEYYNTILINNNISFMSYSFKSHQSACQSPRAW